jgi:trehalose/maltose transport system substrate-binding protein
MKRLLGTVGLLAGAAFAIPAQAAAVAISCGSVGLEFEVCRQGAEAWARETGNQVRFVSTPNQSNERLALYQQLLAAQSGDIDVFQIDVVWTGILGNHFIDMSEVIPQEVQDEIFPSVLSSSMLGDKLVAVPWFTDAGLLYYREDLLEKYERDVPRTWVELAGTARFIQQREREAGDTDMWGYVWQGRPYEGLTVNALEWIVSFGGGTIVDEKGEITIDNPQAAEAIETAASWVNGISPPGVLNYSEEEARGVFQSGNAVFMRNWPYAWPLANSEDSPVRGKVAVATLPKGGEQGKSTATLGGWQLGVSRYSENAEAAIDLVRYLTGEAEQKRRAVVGGYNPTISSLYEDPDVLQANPFFGELYDTFVNATARPSVATGDRYNQMSAEFWNAVHRVLSGQQEAGPALEQLESTLDRVSRGGRW